MIAYGVKEVGNGLAQRRLNRPRRVAELSLGFAIESDVDRSAIRTPSAVPEGGFRVTWSAMNSSVAAAASATLPGIGIRRIRRPPSAALRRRTFFSGIP